MSILQSYRLAVFPALLMGSVAIAQNHPINNNKLVSAAQFREQTSILPYLDTSYEVISFTFSMQVKGGEYVGPYSVGNHSFVNKNAEFRNNADVQKAISRAKAGDKIYIEDIKVRTPDGRPRALSSVVLTLN